MLNLVTHSDGYIHLIEYFTSNLEIFAQTEQQETIDTTPSAIFEEQLCHQIITICSQNENLTFEQRNAIIREVDSIFDDFEEVLARLKDQNATPAQQAFIVEYTGLLKNLFDNEIRRLQLHA